MRLSALKYSTDERTPISCSYVYELAIRSESWVYDLYIIPWQVRQNSCRDRSEVVVDGCGQELSEPSVRSDDQDDADGTSQGEQGHQQHQEPEL